MKIWFSPEAVQAAREKRAWWEAHRDKAPRAFVEELALVVRKLRDGTHEEQQRYGGRDGRVVWRLLMPRTRNDVYFVIDHEHQRIEIITIWSSLAATGPAL